MPASPRLQALLRAKEENEIGNFLSAVLEAQDEIGGIEAERYMEIMDRSPYSTGVSMSVGYDDESAMSPLDLAAIVSSAIPIVGDVTGLAADADMYARDPESRNMVNYLLSAAGAIPLIPAASQVRKISDSAMDAGIAPGRTTKTLRGVEFDEGFDPRVKEQERLQNLELQIEERPMAEKPVISLEDLEGRPFLTSMSDRTSAGGRLMAVNDVDLGEGVDLKGGQDFMFDNPDMVWASDPQVVAGLKKRADILRRQTGKDPIYLPWQMAPTGGDHATMTTEVMLRHAKSNMMKKDQKALDKEIKQIIPDWKGVNDPTSIDQIYNVSGDKRKQIQQLMDVGYREKGGMSRGEARLAVSDMTQLQGRQGRLINVGEIGEGDIIVDSGHPTYLAALRGQGLGSLDRDIVATQILPAMVDTRRIADPAKPSAQDIRALQMKGYYGIIDEDLLRSLER